MKLQGVKLVIGLGNPGEAYEKTYHNVGFLFVDYLDGCQMLNVKCQMSKSDVFMNQSGNFVKKMLKKHGVKPEEILIVHDDSDIELGKYKLSFGRGSAGHKGAESIIKSLGAKNFWRLRIGIRRGLARTARELTRKKASDMVLKKISKADLGILNKIFKKIEKEIINK